LVVIRIRLGISNHFFIFFTNAEYGIVGHLLAFLIQSTADLYRTWRNDSDADKIMHPQHFGTDPIPTDIRIRINPKFRIGMESRITLVEILALAEVSGLWVLLLLFLLLLLKYKKTVVL